MGRPRRMSVWSWWRRSCADHTRPRIEWAKPIALIIVIRRNRRRRAQDWPRAAASLLEGLPFRGAWRLALWGWRGWPRVVARADHVLDELFSIGLARDFLGHLAAATHDDQPVGNG